MPLNSREALKEKVTEIAERVGRSEGIEVVDVELRGTGNARLLRIYIDKPQGVSHGDCEFMSQQIGTILDVEDIIPGGRYTLELSSPGVERKLTRPRDFERYVGQAARITLAEPVENQKHWVGRLSAFADNTITLEVAPGKTVQFGLDKVQKANLKFDW